jgi:hypothetical protein
VGPGRCRWGCLVTIRRGEILLAPQSQILHDGRQVPLIANTTYVSTVLVLLANSEGERWRGYRFAVSRDARTFASSICIGVTLTCSFNCQSSASRFRSFDDFFPLLIPIVVDLVELCSTTLTVARSSSRAEPPPCFHRWPFLVDLISPGSQTSDLMQE